MDDPQQQADAFMAANDRSPVVAGAVVHRAPSGAPEGVSYTLQNRTRRELTSAAARLLPDGYPRWNLDWRPGQ